MNFLEKTVVVTGAGGNLGQAVASAFAEVGANLVLMDLSYEKLQRVYGEASSRKLFVPVNLMDVQQVKEGIALAIKRFGRIDILCNLAGGFRMGTPIHETTDQDWSFLFDLNSRSVLHTVREVTPIMIAAGGGKIINIGAQSALKGIAQMGIYCASKDVVIRITEAMSAELRAQNINVNCVLPSILNTPENRAAMPDADPSQWVSPEALADVIVFLASENARAIHGAAVPVVGRS